MTQVKSSVFAGNDYYPFGLKFNSYSRENSLPNKMKLFQGQEHVDDLGLNWDSFKWRNHQPDIGRFFNVDPLAEKYYYNSPYAFSENKVVAHRELEGLESWSIHLSDGTSTVVGGPWQNQLAAEHHADNQLMISPISNPRMTSPVNMNRMHPTLHVVRLHRGVDLVRTVGVTRGSQVSAPLNGRVLGKGFQAGGAGNFVKIQATKDGLVHKFFHMENGSTTHLTVNQQVNRGDRIGTIGDTGGISSGAHLHYEVRGQNGSTLQPHQQNQAIQTGLQNISVVPVNNNTDPIRKALKLL